MKVPVEMTRLTATLMGAPLAGVIVMLPPELFTGAPGPIVTEIVRGVELSAPLAGLN